MSEIFKDINDLKLQTEILEEQLVVTSGGFDPMHVGHLRCLIDSAKIAKKINPRTKLAVIVNGDGFLLRKKGYAFMPFEERAEIISCVKGVDYVVYWDDGSQTVVGAIEILKPVVFTKGGDRDEAANVPEFEVCEKISCKVTIGVGGGKIQSSSSLVKSAYEMT